MRPRFTTRNSLAMPSKINIDLRRPQLMAILNVTPDSFYSESRTFTRPEIEARVKEITRQGATIIDVGGYSSRPNAEDVSPEEEWCRVERALEVIKTTDPSITVSLDTFRSQVARRAIERFGALIINDISAGKLEDQMIGVAAEFGVPYIAMHMKGSPQTMQQKTSYNDVTEEVIEYFKAKIKQLKAAGVEDIILDPGFGFAKTLDQNYELMRSMDKICALGYPVLSGISRKSMIYNLLGVTPAEALAGTIALNWESLRAGARILRVHDVKEAAHCIAIFNKTFEL